MNKTLMMLFAVAVMIPATVMGQSNPMLVSFDASTILEDVRTVAAGASSTTYSDVIDSANYTAMQIQVDIVTRPPLGQCTADYVLRRMVGVSQVDLDGTLNKSAGINTGHAGVFIIVPVSGKLKFQYNVVNSTGTGPCSVKFSTKLLAMPPISVVSGNELDAFNNTHPVIIGGVIGGAARTISVTEDGSLPTKSRGNTYTDNSYALSVGTTSSCFGQVGSGCAATADEDIACWRVSCNVDVFVRSVEIGGSIVATTSDMDLPARTIDKMCLDGDFTSLAFITATGSGTCKLTKIRDR